jgi:hypothetical protein
MTPETTALVARLIARASHHGCSGPFDGNCVEESPHDYTEWCVYCLAGEAAKALTAADSPVQGERQDGPIAGRGPTLRLAAAILEKTDPEQLGALANDLRVMAEECVPSAPSPEGQDERIKRLTERLRDLSEGFHNANRNAGHRPCCDHSYRDCPARICESNRALLAERPTGSGQDEREQLRAIATALKAYPDSDLVSLAMACRSASERYDALYAVALPAIEQAIANEDGLDGGDGERILREFGYWPKRTASPPPPSSEKGID